MSKNEKISIQIHPRVFAAFGADLVTSDSVAVTELVKNCYDAFAFNAVITFGKEDNGEAFIQIEDDGLGMTREVIKEAWATVATPYKKKNPIVERIVISKEKMEKEKRIRHVSGNKGLGRFSAARLGTKLYMITKNADDNCVQAFMDWDEIANAESLNQYYINIFDKIDNPFDRNSDKTGTIIKITGLKSVWDEDKIMQLRDELSRLISPFEHVADFSIKIKSFYDSIPVDITVSPFINNPIYMISGNVDSKGTASWKYYYKNHNISRDDSGKLEWIIQEKEFEQLTLFGEIDNGLYKCGPFSFEIRAWDLDIDSIADVADSFKIKKSEVRKSISLYKGLSVYRDNVLVLPKSDASRDWLRLDERRISNIGRRISTSQIVGIINISAENNPEIKDTTDREKLVDTIEYKQFVKVVDSIIDKLQSERLKDRVENQKKANLKDLLVPLSSKELLQKAEYAMNTGQGASAIIKHIKEYDKENEKNLTELSTRLIYYAQTASLGSIAIVILHEFLTGMTAIKRFLNRCKQYIDLFDEKTNEYLGDANIGHKRISDVANSFSPLYRKDLRKSKNTCNLLDVIEKSVRLIQSKKICIGVEIIYDMPNDIRAKMHEGELQTIFINLLDNACYWIHESHRHTKKIIIELESNLNDGRVNISVSDNGIGVLEEETQRIFNPGITSKPHGIGMGLVIVAELLSYYDGKIGVRMPGNLEGATFVFDIPIEREV